jgi:hypothetical protein
MREKLFNRKTECQQHSFAMNKKKFAWIKSKHCVCAPSFIIFFQSLLILSFTWIYQSASLAQTPKYAGSSPRTSFSKLIQLMLISWLFPSSNETKLYEVSQFDQTKLLLPHITKNLFIYFYFMTLNINLQMFWDVIS